ncbi:hypothetical protein N7462_005953 [Penicillium macrosclerotiorum]|uniref:uncharacterized protein n=1 Tax=Penicillium macrosclerotiorum TaxID=303699 RepID=UPI002548371C|nr:uncharacterized protein N7462_005953 [Penicillium macrosclerotiorum]KAJ5682788.1 hypothetical protein N7462_005953 [Penicillium macrosclerotiorum]
MTSTTLMTFLLVTNPEIRSVKLLGSWDNFSRPYAMERDKRVGPGHWRGCHTFTDIIGDGPPGDKVQWRSGGLKMGQTYWYYYLLDEDVEYFNQAEPVTTKCPLLPGQPVNVLNVPIILPDSRSHVRSNSNSSQKSEHRTMNPEDKFMNPRKPPKPNLARLQTSVPHATTSNPSSISPINGIVHRSASQPNSATRRYHSKDARSVSPPRSRALRPAFRPVQEVEKHTWVEMPSRSNTVNGVLQQRNAATTQHRNLPGISINTGAVSSVQHQPEMPASTIQSRRALKANGGDGPQARNLLTVQTRPHHRKPSASRGAAAGPTLGTVDETQALREALTLATSGDITPKGVDVHEKRLPTLPNTPSSVMDEAVRAIDERDKAMDAEVMQSHFSSFTTTTADDSTNSRFIVERSRFSEWSTDTDTETEDNSPESMISGSTFDQESHESSAEDDWKTPDLSQANDAATNTDPNTPHLTVHSKPSSPNSSAGDILPWNMGMAVPELTLSLSSPGLGIDHMAEVESNPKRHAALFSALESMEALSLSQSRDGSPILLPELQRLSDTDRSDTTSRELRERLSNASLRGKNTMQELMDELSYLKNMIQAEMDGEPF